MKKLLPRLHSHRAKRYLKLPKHSRHLQISVPFSTTKAGDEFLLWQSAPRHILVFALGSNIRLLAGMRTWGKDATFKVVAQWYQQLLTIHAFLADKLVPAVYCLCTGKDIETYGFIFQALINKAAGYFPNMREQGCYFQFCQAIHRNVDEVGKKTRYKTGEDTKRKIRILLATAFLLIPHVDTGDSLLEDDTTGIENGTENKMKMQMTPYKNP
ncbi:hypothetical protein T4D_14693 [Trichinella pseudospiralis]|uniref:MULE transposase domain-containing protein n=1 Tax=Trichinella pseudospiralis TaxID=6337 RepID=A0A0V1G1H7_TRIPS|nr:hypothetical protein T4D_14693 [Trichinella pseudospiralis]